MKRFIRLLLFCWCVCLLLNRSVASAAQVSCSSNGSEDVTSCLQDAMNSAQQNGDAQVFMPAGRFMISNEIVVPDRIHLSGVGTSAAGMGGTVIFASPNFPLHGVMVEMGTLNQLDFGVKVTNLRIDGRGRADICLQNLFSMEQSYGQDLYLTGYLLAGLDIEGSSAQNSGPFTQITITPSSSATSDTGCVIVTNVISFRGLSAITCDGAESLSRPGVAFQLDGQALYSSLQVRHFVTAVSLGSTATSAEGLALMGAMFGPDVDNGIVINSETPSQDVSIFGVSCPSCTTAINDTVTGRTSTAATTGWYLLGNGAGIYKKVLSSDLALTDTEGNFQDW